MRPVTGWASGVEVRAGGVGESELDKLVSMSSGPELLVRNSSLSLSTSGQGEPRGSEEGEGDGKEEVEEEVEEEEVEEEEVPDGHLMTLATTASANVTVTAAGGNTILETLRVSLWPGSARSGRTGY